MRAALTDAFMQGIILSAGVVTIGIEQHWWPGAAFVIVGAGLFAHTLDKAKHW